LHKGNLSSKGIYLYQRGDNKKNANIGWPGDLKILFSRTNDPEKLKIT
jgi:hypothetical protein